MHYEGTKSYLMIGWIKGQRIDNWQQGTKHWVLLACSGVGYEVQTTKKHLAGLEHQEICVLWVHQIQKDDGISLFGFPNKHERDLFRALIGVNGVGPQVAISLIESSNHSDLIHAILQGDLPTLCRAQGVGRRTAERITVELRSKLSALNCSESLLKPVKSVVVPPAHLNSEALKDIFSTLKGLGYEDLEINDAVLSLAKEISTIPLQEQQNSLSPEDSEGWIKAIIMRLSQDAA